MQKHLLHIAFFLFPLLAFGQITVNTELSKDTLDIGEPVVLNISVSVPQGVKISNIDFSAFDSLESEVKTSDIPDSLLRTSYAEIEWPRDDYSSGRSWPISQFVKTGNYYQKSIEIRFWDIGVFLMPQLKIELDSSQTEVMVQYLESPYVMVLPPEDMQPQDTTQMIMPIQSIFEEEKTWEDYLWLVYALGFAFTIGIILYMIKKANDEELSSPIVEPEIIRPSHELGLEKLSALKNKKLWQQGKIKEYQSELTYIIREYLENRFDIPALETTTDEILNSLKTKDFNTIHEKHLKDILQIADLVKFAKARPEENVHSMFMDQAVDFVEQTRLIISKLEGEDGDIE